MEEKIWIQLNGSQQGPYTLAQLAMMYLAPDTPVWYQDLPDWTIAINAPLTASLFVPGNNMPPRYTPPYAPGQQEAKPPCPRTYMVWSILVTLCCCLIGGIVAIVYSSQVTTLYSAGDYAGAVKASERAQTWIIVSVVVGLLTAVPYALFSGLFVMPF